MLDDVIVFEMNGKEPLEEISIDRGKKVKSLTAKAKKFEKERREKAIANKTSGFRAINADIKYRLNRIENEDMLKSEEERISNLKWTRFKKKMKNTCLWIKKHIPRRRVIELKPPTMADEMCDRFMEIPSIRKRVYELLEQRGKSYDDCAKSMKKKLRKHRSWRDFFCSRKRITDEYDMITANSLKDSLHK